MEQVEVEVTGLLMTQRYGTLTTGTILRTDLAYAKHLVDDCNGAKFTAKKAAPETETVPAKKHKGK